jgi:uncharacterized protein (TIGR04255 family)
MSVTFKNAPLVEMIAELRWGETAQPVQQGLPIVMQGMTPEVDQFFMRLSGEVYQHGFRRAERLVPPGFPIFPFQPVFRYRKDTADDNSVLFQAGQGLFSVNAVPPYRSWDTVSPIVRTGITALLKARAPNDNDKPFTVVNLRYINAFGPKLTNNRSIGEFIEGVFGFSLALPSVVSKHIKQGSQPNPQIQISFPLSSGASMLFSIREGAIKNERTFIMDMTISCEEPVAPDVEAVMTALTDARNVIHSIFVDLTTPIHSLLEPVEDNQNA